MPKIRKRGALAAKTSLHIEGMATDINLAGVDGKTLWEYVRSLDCCGAGYYHGKGIHVDVGPSRFWDETSTKIGQDLGSHNKLLLLRTDWDIYEPGETIYMSLTRITDYPVGIRPISFSPQKSSACTPIKNRQEAHALILSIPKDFSHHEKMTVQMSFCDKTFPEMP